MHRAPLSFEIEFYFHERFDLHQTQNTNTARRFRKYWLQNENNNQKTQLSLHMLRFWAVLFDFLWFVFQFARLALILSLYLCDSLSMFFCLCANFFIWYLCVLIVIARHCFDSSDFFWKICRNHSSCYQSMNAKGSNLSTWIRIFFR